MRRVCRLAALLALLCASEAKGAAVIFDFEGGGDQGFGHKFSNDVSEEFPTVNIGGSTWIEVLRDGDFQEAERTTADPGDAQYLAMDAASGDEAGYLLSYDWHVDTSSGEHGTFLQVGTYVNTGNGYYAQDFPGAGKDVELSAGELVSGSVFSGTVTETFSEKGFDLPTGQTFFRLGLIINGDGPVAKVYFDNVSISPVVPEPTSMALLAATLSALGVMRRR